MTTEQSISDSFSLQNLSGVHLGIVLAKTKKICFIAENVFVFELSTCICNLVFCVVIHCFGWLGLAQRAWCQNCFQVPTTLDSREEETWFVNIRPFDKFKCTFIICDHLDSTDNICDDEHTNVHELCLSVIRSIISNASTATFSFFYQLMTFTSRPISDIREFSILNLRLFH